jgi:hypothetical protein
LSVFPVEELAFTLAFPLLLGAAGFEKAENAEDFSFVHIEYTERSCVRNSWDRQPLIKIFRGYLKRELIIYLLQKQYKLSEY